MRVVGGKNVLLQTCLTAMNFVIAVRGEFWCGTRRPALINDIEPLARWSRNPDWCRRGAC